MEPSTTTSFASILGIAFLVGAVIIVGRLFWLHRTPRVPRRIRKLGPLPPDPGMRKPPDTSRDPFRN